MSGRFWNLPPFAALATNWKDADKPADGLLEFRVRTARFATEVKSATDGFRTFAAGVIQTCHSMES